MIHIDYRQIDNNRLALEKGEQVLSEIAEYGQSRKLTEGQKRLKAVYDDFTNGHLALSEFVWALTFAIEICDEAIKDRKAAAETSKMLVTTSLQRRVNL